MTRTITLELDSGDLMYHTIRLMHFYIYNPQGPDYRCMFCSEEPPHNDGQISHKDDCFGQKILDAMKEPK